MFTKVEDVDYGAIKGTKLRDLGKKYTYSEDVNIFTIANMLEESAYKVSDIDISVDDDYAFGSGTYDFKTFYDIYDKITSVKSVSFDIESINTMVIVYPDDRELYLFFNRVPSMPEIEITDIINEKKMKI